MSKKVEENIDNFFNAIKNIKENTDKINPTFLRYPIYFILLDVLSKYAFPNEEEVGKCFINFIDIYSNWEYKNYVSILLLNDLLVKEKNKECFTENEEYRDLEKKVNEMASEGLKVLAVAYGKTKLGVNEKCDDAYLKDLNFIALVGMIDPLRPETKEAIRECQEAGIDVTMVTGDNPLTAYAISKELGFVESQDEVVIGAEIKSAKNESKNYITSIRKFKICDN